MKIAAPFKQKGFLYAFFGLVLFGSYAAAVWNGAIEPPNTMEEIPDVPQRLEVSGETTCLPKKGPGPHTLECAIGLRADDGAHYALDLSVLQTQAGMGLDTGEQIQVEGVFVPVEQLSAEQWLTYDIRGIIQVVILTRGE